MNTTLEQAKVQLEIEHQFTARTLQSLEQTIQAGVANWSDRSLWQKTRGRLHHIEQAQARVNSGCYGLCRTCGRAINPERLTLVPYAEVCMSCHGKAVRHQLHNQIQSHN